MTELTDLEGAALADIASSGAKTSYAIARNFAQSPSEFWSGSAGSVYPMIKRLLDRGLLAATETADGKRMRTDYSLTPAGETAMRAWLLDARRAAGIGFDPLRTRAVHLNLVSAEERARFLEEVRLHLDEAARQIVAPEEPRFQAIHASVMAARKAWFKALSAIVR